MPLVLALSVHAGRTIAEVGFLLLVIAGIWIAAAQAPQMRFKTLRMVVGGVALAIGGVLLIVATHWGHFG
jgi:hypothetical protein